MLGELLGRQLGQTPALLERVPELRAVFGLGARVVAVGRTRAIAVTDDGAAELPAAALAALVTAW